MNVSTVMGIVVGFGLMIGAILLRGNVLSFISLDSFMITMGGTIGATLLSFNIDQIIIALRAVKVVFIRRTTLPDDLIPTMVELIRQARMEGLAGIELKDEASDRSQFLRKAITLIEDGFEPDVAAQILKSESDAIAARYRMTERLFSVMGSFAPQFGLLGTLIGLIIMLHSVSDPKAIPGAMGVALITTFYGVTFSALVFRPIATKIRAWNYDEIALRELIIETLTYIDEGVNSQVAQERLESYFTQRRRA